MPHNHKIHIFSPQCNILYLNECFKRYLPLQRKICGYCVVSLFNWIKYGFHTVFWFAGVLKPPPDVLNPGKRKISFDLVRDDGKGYFYGPSDPADESSTPSRTSTSKQSSGQEKFFYLFMNFDFNLSLDYKQTLFWRFYVSRVKSNM